jgi:hypothetical protein
MEKGQHVWKRRADYPYPVGRMFIIGVSADSIARSSARAGELREGRRGIEARGIVPGQAMGLKCNDTQV